MKPHRMGANHHSSMLSTCCNLAGNRSTVADSGESQVKFDSINLAGRGSNQVKFDSSKSADICRNQVKFDSSYPADSSSPQIKFDSSTFTARPKDGGALFARYMLEIYSRLAAQRLPNFGFQFPQTST